MGCARHTSSHTVPSNCDFVATSRVARSATCRRNTYRSAPNAVPVATPSSVSRLHNALSALHGSPRYVTKCNTCHFA